MECTVRVRVLDYVVRCERDGAVLVTLALLGWFTGRIIERFVPCV